MNEESLKAIVEQLNNNKAALEKEDGNLIESISIGKDYDKDGNNVYGVSIRYSTDVMHGTLTLLSIVEGQVGQKCLWYRFSPKDLFIYFN